MLFPYIRNESHLLRLFESDYNKSLMKNLLTGNIISFLSIIWQKKQLY